MTPSEGLIDLLAAHRFKGILLDTNLLLLKIISQLGASSFRESHHLRNFVAEDAVLLDGLLGRVQRLVATPHTLTEASNLLGHERAPLRKAARAVLAADIDLFEERSTASPSAIKTPVFLRLGLTDVAIGMIAANALLVLTVDRDLAVYLEEIGVSVLNFNHVRTGAW